MGSFTWGNIEFPRKSDLDTISVDPHCQHKFIGKRLIKEFMYLRTLAFKINTLVDWNDPN
jgi:ribosomal protein S18 acetylase RimI-like enzyme